MSTQEGPSPDLPVHMGCLHPLHPPAPHPSPPSPVFWGFTPFNPSPFTPFTPPPPPPFPSPPLPAPDLHPPFRPRPFTPIHPLHPPKGHGITPATPLFDSKGSRGHACPGLRFTRCDHQDFSSRHAHSGSVLRVLDSALSHCEIHSVPPLP